MYIYVITRDTVYSDLEDHVETSVEAVCTSIQVARKMIGRPVVRITKGVLRPTWRTAPYKKPKRERGFADVNTYVLQVERFRVVEL